MNFRVKKKEDVHIDFTPLIDIVFLLLIFFMVSTTFERESEINITLPMASQEAVIAQPDVIQISIDADERVFIAEQPLALAELANIRQALRDALQGREAVPVVISADAGVSHQSVIRIMDAARQLGLVNITFATRLPDEAE
ncbi:MAG: ExbD/TolR family protein [Gammaproteobacteria bacterium]